jgi:hypothetical protein
VSRPGDGGVLYKTAFLDVTDIALLIAQRPPRLAPGPGCYRTSQEWRIVFSQHSSSSIRIRNWTLARSCLAHNPENRRRFDLSVARVGSLLVWKRDAPCADRVNDHHFWSLIMPAVTAGGLLLVNLGSHKGTLFLPSRGSDPLKPD